MISESNNEIRRWISICKLPKRKEINLHLQDFYNFLVLERKEKKQKNIFHYNLQLYNFARKYAFFQTIAAFCLIYGKRSEKCVGLFHRQRLFVPLLSSNDSGEASLLDPLCRHERPRVQPYMHTHAAGYWPTSRP